MTTETGDFTPLVDDDLARKVRALKAEIEGINETIGQWSVKTDARQSGCSLHIKYASKVDILDSLHFASALQMSLSRAHLLCRIVLGESE